MKICIAATIKFRKQSEGIGDLIARCYQDLFRDASLYTGTMDTPYILNFSGHFLEQYYLSALLSSRSPSNTNPHVGKQCVRLVGTALKQASIAIALGLYTLMAVVGTAKMTPRATDKTTSILSYVGG